MQINHIDIRKLRYFIAVAEELNFSHAANRLHMSQPALSLQIKALEQELETLLLKRTKRHVELTPAGNYLLKAARPMLRQMQDALLYTQAAGRGDVGELRITVNFSTLFSPRFKKVIATFHKAYPHVRLIIKEAIFEDAMKSLAAQQSDLCFVWPYSLKSDGNTKFQLFSKEPMRLCLAANHPLARKKNLATSDLKNTKILMSPRQGGMRLFRNLQDNARKAGFFLHIEQEVIVFPIIANLVSTGYGVAYLPEEFITPDHKNLVYRDLSDIKQSDCTQILAIAYATQTQNPLIEKFLEIADKA